MILNDLIKSINVFYAKGEKKERERYFNYLKSIESEEELKELKIIFLDDYKNAYDFLIKNFAWWDLELDEEEEDAKELKQYKNIVDYLNDKKGCLCDLIDYIYYNKYFIIY